jgi:DNA-directed RNA polymerase subunit beta
MKKGNPILAEKLTQLFNFEKQKPILDMPDLLQLQKQSYRNFLEKGLQEIFEEIFPIRDQNYVLEYIGHEYETPKHDLQECKDKGFNYGGVLKLKARLLVKDTGEAKEGMVVIGDLPKMTPTGSFIINGTERVVVSQLIRSPGVYFSPLPEKTTGVRGYTCTVIPDRGTWLEFELEESSDTREGGLFVKVDKRSKKIAVTILLKALGYASNQELALLLKQFQVRTVSLLDHEIPRETIDLSARKQLAAKVQKKRAEIMANSGHETPDPASAIHRWLERLPRQEIDLQADPRLVKAIKRLREKLLLQFSRPEKLISEAFSEVMGKVLADSLSDPSLARIMAETVKDPNTGEILAKESELLTQKMLAQFRQAGLTEIALAVPLRSQLEGYLQQLTLAETIKDPVSGRVLAERGETLSEKAMASLIKMDSLPLRVSLAPRMDTFLREGMLAERGQTLGEKALFQLFSSGADWITLEIPLTEADIPYLIGRVLSGEVLEPHGGQPLATAGEALTEANLRNLIQAGVEKVELAVSLRALLDRFLEELGARTAIDLVDPTSRKTVVQKGQAIDAALLRTLLLSGIEPLKLMFFLPPEVKAFLSANQGAILAEELQDSARGKLLFPAGTVLDEFNWLKVLFSGIHRCQVQQVPLPPEISVILPELSSYVLAEPVSHPASGEVLADKGQRLVGEPLLRVLLSGATRFEVVQEPFPVETALFFRSLEGAVLADSVIDPSSNLVLAETGQELSQEHLLRFALAGVEELEVVESVLDPELEATFAEKRDPSANQDEAQIELYKRLHPGEPPTRESAKALVKNLFLDHKRNDLGAVGRYKLNKKLYAEEANRPSPEERTITKEDILEIVRYFLGLKKGPQGSGYFLDPSIRTLLVEQFRPTTSEMLQAFLRIEREADGTRLSLDPSSSRYVRDQDRFRLARMGEFFQDPISRHFFRERDLIPYSKGYGVITAQRLVPLPPHDIDEIDHLGNRRVRTVGELLQNQLRMGFVRTERNIRDRMTTVAPEEADPKALINPRPVVAAIREFFGSSQLSQFMDETNPLSALTHKRRLSSLGPGGLNRERAGVEVRDIHYSHYGRVCPIETPEGPNIGLINSLTNYSQVNDFGFLVTPYRKVREGHVSEEIVYLTADEEEKLRIAETNVPLAGNGRLLGSEVLVRHGEIFENVLPTRVDLMDISPRQVFSVSASLIPFLEHDDPIRALMGCNMQRQAVPLLKPQLAIVASGLEPRVAIDSGEVIVAQRKGKVKSVTANRIEVQTDKGIDRYPLRKFNRSNRATCINQRPIVQKGAQVVVGTPIADGAATVQGELALGSNVLVALLPWAGYNYEDAIVISERLVREDVYTSIHIEEFEVEARDTKLGPEEITHEVPNVAEDMLRNLDESGVIRIGAEVRAGDILVGKVTPKGETELSPEERLLRAIFGEKAREVRDTSLRVPHGEKGTVVDVKVFSKENGDELQTGVLKKVKVYVAQKRKVMEGDKMSGRHGNKGVVSIVVPEADMPFLPNGRPVDIVLNPLGVPSRMNVGQVLELHLGLAGETLGKRFYTPVFSGASEMEVVEKLREAGLPENGKTILYDGRTGEPFDREVAVGVMYIMKLIHLVEDKIHARSIGPYSLVTQQPLGGKAQFGGQRFGEMEVWALEAYGAASVLQEMLTVKSDDITGRVKTYESIVKGKDSLTYSLPESFKVLMKELQGLCLDFKLISEKEGEITLKESDEDIRKKADELDLILNVRPEEVVSDARKDE